MLACVGGSVPTKVGTYQGGVVASAGAVPTEVGTYQSGVKASVGVVPTKVGTYQSGVMASVGSVRGPPRARRRYQSARSPMLPSMMRRFSLRSPPSSRM